RCACKVETVEQVALAEEVAFGRVHVLRLQGVVVQEAPGLKASNPSAPVGEREQQAAAEVVVPAPVRQPGPGELVARVPLLHRSPGERSAAGSEAEAELAAHLLAQAARGEVVAGKATCVRLPEAALVERRRPVEDL